MAIHRRGLLLTNFVIVSASMASGQQPDEGPTAVAGAEVFIAREFTAADGAVLRYRLLEPTKDAPQQKLPLVLFLHGAGERGDDNVRQLIHGGRNFADPAMRRRHPALVVAPQCPEGQRWVEVDWDSDAHHMPAQPSAPLRKVLTLLAELQREFNVDAGRIYAVGLSMGGFGVWDILQRQPDLLAAAVPICGGGDPEYAAAFVNTPVWAFHGGKDPVVDPRRSRSMVQALVAAGGRPIYTEYEDVEHNSWTQTFDNPLVWDWLFAQRRN
jgi:predicted peptidase